MYIHQTALKGLEWNTTMNVRIGLLTGQTASHILSVHTKTVMRRIFQWQVLY